MSSVKLTVQRYTALIGREQSRDHAHWAVIGAPGLVRRLRVVRGGRRRGTCCLRDHRPLSILMYDNPKHSPKSK